jgi:hypothetical protein
MIMPKINKPHDVFQHIDMHGGDTSVCWEWKRPLSGSGRPYFDLNKKKVLAYRLTYNLMHEVPLKDDEMARHTCDNERCCNPYHIIPGTNQQNMNDMKERQRHGLPHHTVKSIKRLLAMPDGERPTQKEIGERFGISREQVASIKMGLCYEHVTIDE